MKFFDFGARFAAIVIAVMCLAGPVAAQNIPPSANELKAYPKVAPGDYPKPPADYSTSKGEWKAFVPKGVHGELGSYDPVGLMAGQLIKADCSINWRDPDTGKLYCFDSGTSLVYFEQFPRANLRKAQAEYERLTGAKPESPES